ncbi:MAG: DUF1800 domain-containing protein [Proteobacteria bacterium]|nr:DUF1800 domain-containing protein [Pseudomonadota bacterium]
MPSNRLSEAASAANRFGLGARPGTLDALGDPRAALAKEVRAFDSDDGAFAGLPSSAQYLRDEIAFQQDKQARKRALEATNGASQGVGKDGKPAKPLGDGFMQVFGDRLLAEAHARWKLALNAPVGFRERIVAFWSNHFAVSVDKRPATLFAAPMEREVIRPLAFGRFEDLLIGVETHPAMLRYLDNVASIGPDSAVGERAAQGAYAQRKNKLGLNENLAREIMELHTLGVNGGYTQADVIELAKAITGWSLHRPQDDKPAQRPFRGRFGGGPMEPLLQPSPITGFVFRPNAHEPGPRTVLGKHYSSGGMEQGRRILSDLAVHPATANHLALQLARHFVSDTPPPALLKRMVDAYLSREGDLNAFYLTLLDSPEAWSPDARKFRTPRDFILASLRAVGAQDLQDVRRVNGLLGRLGEADFMPRSPAGFADTADSWIGPDAIWKRIQIAEEFAKRAPPTLDVSRLASAALGPHLRRATAQAIARAGDPQTALGVLLGSPDFQWRA